MLVMDDETERLGGEVKILLERCWKISRKVLVRCLLWVGCTDGGG